jgi:hypothetical protein
LETTIYSEEISLTQWALIMIGLFITVLTPTIILEALAIYKEPWSLTLYVILDLLFILIMMNFRKMIITIDSTYLVAAFGLIKKKIRLEDIKACEPVDASFSVYTGMGIRYGGDGSLAYLPSLGDAVRLSFENGRPFVFSTRNQQQVLDIINHHCE